jgi:hypothetical protein
VIGLGDDSVVLPVLHHDALVGPAEMPRRRILVATDPCGRGCGGSVGNLRTKDVALRELCVGCRAVERSRRDREKRNAAQAGAR